MADVVTVFLRNRGKILLTRRSAAVETYSGRWAGVSGYLEGDPADAVADARRELREEVGLTDVRLIRAGEPLTVEDERTFTVHPFLFACEDRDVATNWELAAVEWVPPTAMLDRETVPRLWETYRRVAPTVETVASDTEHGSAYLSVRALEVLRDRAAVVDDWEPVTRAARALRDARPSMAVLRNRINRVMDAATTERTPAAVHEHALDELEAAFVADEGAAATAADVLADIDGAVLTISRSGTVLAALRRAEVPVVVSESRPGREGVAVAESVAADGSDVTLIPDAALSFATAALDVGAILVGADTVLPDGRVVNKVGTRGLGLAAAADEVPCYVVTATDKISHRVTAELEDAAINADVDPRVNVWTPRFDVTSAVLFDGVLTERGRLAVADVKEVAAEHERRARWGDGPDESAATP